MLHASVGSEVTYQFNLNSSIELIHVCDVHCSIEWLYFEDKIPVLLHASYFEGYMPVVSNVTYQFHISKNDLKITF